MRRDRLFIPLTANVTSQKVWRLFRVSFLLMLGAVVGAGLFQAQQHAEQISVTGYPANLVTIHLLKTPRSLAFFANTSQATTIFANAPMTVQEALLESRRGIYVFVSEGEVIGYLTDAEFFDDNVSLFGYTATTFNDHTIVSAAQYTPTIERVVRPRLVLQARLDGEIVQSDVEKKILMRFDKNAIIVRNFPLLQPAVSTLTLPKNTEPLAALTMLPAHLSFMGAMEVPLVYSNSALMIKHLTEHGFSAVIGQDLQGIALHLSTAAGAITATQAAAFGKEFVEITKITYDPTNELLTLRPNLPGKVAITAEKDLSFITASSEQSLLSLALSAETLAANNRLLEADNIGAIEQRLCGVTTAAYIRPRAVTELWPSTGKLEATTMMTLLGRAEAVVTKRTTTTICFSQVGSE